MRRYRTSRLFSDQNINHKSSELLTLLPKNSRKCTVIAICVIVQCIVVVICAATVLECLYSPDKALFEFDELARIMYLYDFRACGQSFNLTKNGTSDIKLDSDAFGKKVEPIQWAPVVITPMTKTPDLTRRYLKISIGFHVIWFAIALLVLGVRFKTRVQLKSVRLVLGFFYYATLGMIIYDVSMGLLFAAHIQRSLTKGMILRYSGRNTTHSAADNDQFAGWVPIVASLCWMRGLVILGLNAYLCRVINYIRTKISKRIFQKKRLKDYHAPFPQAYVKDEANPSILYYRSDENLESISA